jgi:two-component sensor histidine kinase
MNLWNYVSNIGVSEHKEFNHADLKRLILFNQVLFFGFFAIIFQVFIFWEFIGIKALVFLLISLTSFISLLLNYKGYSYISKRIFILMLYSIGSYTTTLIGGAGLYHFGAFSIFIATLVIFDIKTEIRTIILGTPILILSICIGEFGWFGAPDFSGHEGLGMMRFLSIFNLFVVITILMIFILRLNHKNEEKLSGRKVELEDLVQIRTEELSAQKNELVKQNKEKIILLKEIHHRVKNNLQIIVSLINLQLSKNDNAVVFDALHDIQGRVLSMSLVHQEMYQSSDFTSIDLKKYIESLIVNIKDLYIENDVEYTLDFGKDRVCDVETAIPIGLIFNEVISNFFKHVSKLEKAYFSISLQNDGGNYVLIYKDNGNGFPEGYTIEEADSLGIELISGLTEQIDGDFRFYNDQGAVYEFRFKTKLS